MVRGYLPLTNLIRVYWNLQLSYCLFCYFLTIKEFTHIMSLASLSALPLFVFMHHLPSSMLAPILLVLAQYFKQLMVALVHFLSFAEQPYDSIPNFSAADALRLTGIGRNEFIDIMNKCRSKVVDSFACMFMDTYVYTHTMLICVIRLH